MHTVLHTELLQTELLHTLLHTLLQIVIHTQVIHTKKNHRTTASCTAHKIIAYCTAKELLYTVLYTKHLQTILNTEHIPISHCLHTKLLLTEQLHTVHLHYPPLLPNCTHSQHNTALHCTTHL